MPEFGKLDCVLTEIQVKPRWKHKPDDTVGQLDRDPRKDDGSGSGAAIVCVRCAYEITKKSQAIQVGDLHEHSQVNPGGFVWNFRCFRSTTGCVPLGPPSAEFPWFPGYTWQIQHCGGCNIHMGWLFAATGSPRGTPHADPSLVGETPAAPGDRFYGLITERIVEVGRD